jgi:alkanesulfonate monooxygenase SsuD/methylene tetrahydromethanopterin reductase-like flavin-dependent oxidoreductase (luciferase family)
MSSHRYIRWAAARVAEGAVSVARDPRLPIVVYVPVAVAPNGADAVRSLKPLIAYYLQRWLPIPSLGSLFTEWGPLSQAEIVTIGTRLEAGEPAEDVIPDELVLDYCIAGDADDCRHQIERLATDGVTDVVLDPTGDLEACRASIRMLGSLRRA